MRGEAWLERVANGLIDCDLPAREWTHEAHWAAALWILARRPDLDPVVEMPMFIRRYNEATGTANTDDAGYHETITQASLRGGAAFLVAAPSGEPLADTHARLLADAIGQREWLLAWWTHERLFSVEARRAWLEPDGGPFPHPPLHVT